MEFAHQLDFYCEGHVRGRTVNPNMQLNTAVNQLWEFTYEY